MAVSLARNVERSRLAGSHIRCLDFSPGTGEPASWAVPGAATISWLEHAAAYAAMKRPLAAARTRAGIADALATITPALLTPGRGGPPAAVLRVALYGHAFNPARAGADPGPAAAAALAWARRHCLPLTALADPAVTRRALDALTLCLDGTRAAAATITRKRAVLRSCLGYAAELGLLAANPWTASPGGPRDLPARRARGQRPPLPGGPGRGHQDPPGADRVLRLPVLRGAAARRSRRAPSRLLHPPARGWGQLTLTGLFPGRRVPGLATARHGNRAASNTARKAPSGRSRSLRSLPASCAGTCGPSDAPKMGGCSRVPVAARSAKAATAGSGTRPAPQPCRRTGQVPSRCAAPTICVMPRCRCGWPPAPRPPRSLPAPGIACASCSASMPTTCPAATRSPASRLSKPSAPAAGPPLAHKNRRGRRESRPSCVRATAGLNGTQLDPKPPPRSGYMFLTCGNADQGDRLYGSRPQIADPGRPGPPSR